jgi:aminocarboxymuconate-semialdehyde decarboxylase
MLIDTHAHVIPSDFPPVGDRAAGDRWPRMEPGEDGARMLHTGAPGGRGLRSQSVCWDPAVRLEAMRAKGVDAEVISPMPGLLGYGLSANDGLDLCRFLNEFVVSLCRSDPRRFFGLGLVPMQDPDLAAREMAEVKNAGLLGVEIASNVNGVSLGDERYDEFFTEIDAQGLAVFVHGLAPTFSDRFPASAAAGFGVAAEIAVGAVSLLASGIFQKHPSIRIALSHGAGGFPLMLTRAQFFWGRTWNEEHGPEQTGVSPSEEARKFYYDSLVFDRRALRYLVDTLGAQRLLIGTDHPFMNRESPVGKTLRSLEMPMEDLEDITWNNAFRWLGIEPPLLDYSPSTGNAGRATVGRSGSES